MNTLTILFSIIGAILIIYHTLKTFKDYKSSKRSSGRVDSEKIEEFLNILRNDSNVQNKAMAFIALMQSSYVLIHVLVNKGNNYDDKIQSKQFCSSLSPKRIQMLRKLGE